MANAALGEPTAFRNAVLLYSAETTFGTAVTPATPLGVFNGSLTKRSSNASYRGPGSPNVQARKGGSAYCDVNLNSEGLMAHANVKGLLEKAARVAGVVPSITLGIGYQDDQASPNRSADQIPGFKINTLELSLDATGGHGPLTGSLSGFGFSATELTSLVPATLSEEPWYTYEGVFQRAGVGYEIRSFSMQLNNNLSRDHVVPASTPASRVRSHSYVTEHGIDVSGTISRYQRSGIDVQANVILQAALSLVLTSITGGQSLSLAFANVDFDDEEIGFDENGQFYSFSWTAYSLVLS